MEKIPSVTPEQTTYYYLNPILLIRSRIREVKYFVLGNKLVIENLRIQFRSMFVQILLIPGSL